MKKTISILISIIMIAGLLAGCVNPDGNRSTGIGGNKQASFDLSKIDSGLIGGNEIFAFNIFQKINSEDGDKSIFISPLSISTALAMTYNGARTTTAEAMAEALQYKGIELENLDIGYKNLLAYLNNVDPKVQLNISNSIWFRKGEEIRSDFLSTNKDNFNAYISEIDFQDIKAADTINDWISKATKSKIDKMIEPPISPDVIMYLINAIYFKGVWTEQFDPKLTSKDDFYIPDGGVQTVNMMRKSKGTIEYTGNKEYQVVRLPYGKGNTSMYIILPSEEADINEFISNMTPTKWNEIKDMISKEKNIILGIPRFKLEYGTRSLMSSLIALGMGEAFGKRADFSGIREDLYIDEVLHRAFIEVNEEGTEAAAATAVRMRSKGGSRIHNLYR